MNFLLIGGADSALKREVIRLYADKLKESADFDLIKGDVPQAGTDTFEVIFTNRITQKSVFVNSRSLTPEVFTAIEHFKGDYPPGDCIVTLIPAPDAPDRHTLMEKFDVTPSDNAVEISLDNLPTTDASHLKAASDEIEEILTNPPFNLL